MRGGYAGEGAPLTSLTSLTSLPPSALPPGHQVPSACWAHLAPSSPPATCREPSDPLFGEPSDLLCGEPSDPLPSSPPATCGEPGDPLFGLCGSSPELFGLAACCRRDRRAAPGRRLDRSSVLSTSGGKMTCRAGGAGQGRGGEDRDVGTGGNGDLQGRRQRLKGRRQRL